MSIGKLIKEKRLELGYSVDDLAKKLGKNRATVYRYEKDEIENLPIGILKPLAEALDTTPGELLNWQNSKAVPTGKIKVDKNIEFIPNMATTKIKVYGSVPAGVPVTAIEDIQGTVDIPSHWLSNGYDYMGIVVKGSSMYPKYQDNDIVVIRVQPDCENGQDCIVYINGDEATLKKVIKNSDCIILQPMNPEYAPIVVDYMSEDFKILGVVVQLVRYV